MKTESRMQSFVCALGAILLALTGSLRAQDEAAAARERRRSPVVKAVEAVNPTVVNINTQKLVTRGGMFSNYFEYADPNSQGGRLQNYSLGSGVIIDEKGYVITNDHVIRRADRVTVSLQDGREFEARIIGTDVQNDIAVLKIESRERLPAARLARSRDLMLGESAIAIGNPFGLGGSVTEGIISAIDREVVFQGKKVFHDFIQTSAVINPGNSGGPLININGEVIGINVAIHSRGPGIGFAIPISRVREVVYGVLDPRMVNETWLGLDIDHTHEGRGAVVGEVDEGGPARLAGLDAGDLIVSLDGRAIDDWIDFKTSLLDYRVGEKFTVDLLRQGKKIETRVALAQAPPSQTDREYFNFVGFEFRDLSADLREKLGDLRGIVVTRVPENSRAAAIGIRPGDVIYSFANVSVQDKNRLMQLIQRFQSQRQVPIHIFRPSENEHYGGELPFTRR